MEEEAGAEDEDDEVEDGDEDGEDDEDEGGSKGGRGQGRERPGQRNAANARERARMRVLSRAFCRLKTTLPWVPPDTKLSKLDTLRLATSYIAHLRAMLAAEAESVASVEATAKGSPVGEEIPDRGRVSTLHPLNLYSCCVPWKHIQEYTMIKITNNALHYNEDYLGMNYLRQPKFLSRRIPLVEKYEEYAPNHYMYIK
ncbi:hypothetical protein J437_LFUL000623 [Ladona fulva]|uniref:BHLH domain-containing protein n=1 Tax=Ladona fulva TaxID=123851 RepID=A0A8K0K9Q8_LADFU|nr:hypothetical protein J437_LFUL000623 [Ladona fulva]